MNSTLSRGELIELVQRIMDADGTEAQLNEMIVVLERNVPHPSVSDLIFYPETELSAEQVVDIATAYIPPRLT